MQINSKKQGCINGKKHGCKCCHPKYKEKIAEDGNRKNKEIETGISCKSMRIKQLWKIISHSESARTLFLVENTNNKSKSNLSQSDRRLMHLTRNAYECLPSKSVSQCSITS